LSIVAEGERQTAGEQRTPRVPLPSLLALLAVSASSAGLVLPNPAFAQAPDAAVAKSRLPPRLQCGETFRASVTMLNTGGTPWTGADALAAVGGEGAFTEESRIAVPARVVVAPGESHTFALTLTAPEIALPSARTAWRMVGADGAPFGETVAQAVPVDCPAPVDDAELVAVDLPARLTCGQRYPAQVKVRNTGTTRWSRGEEYALGAVEGGADFHAPARVALEAGVAVPPEAEHAFQATLTAPGAAGTYRIEWRMARAAGGWFGPTVAQAVKVACAP